MELTCNSVLFFMAIPLQFYINRFHKRNRRFFVKGEPTTVTLTLARKPPLWKRVLPCLPTSKRRQSRPTPFPGTNAEKDKKNTKEIGDGAVATWQPALNDFSSKSASLADRRESPETNDGAMDDSDRTSALLQSRPAANPTPAIELAISSSTALRPEPEQVNDVEQPSRVVASPLQPSSEAVPAVVYVPNDRRAKPNATQKIILQGDQAGRRSLSDVPREEGHRAERSSAGCGLWPKCNRKARGSEPQEPQEPQEPRITEPEKPWGSELKKPRGRREPRPRFTRSSGSMARPWGLKQPPGLPF